jgi:hypothetical protein
MKQNHQPTLNGIHDWSKPQAIPFNELIPTIAEANAAGFEPVRMTTDRKRGEYVLSFQRKPDAAAIVARIVTDARLAAYKPADAPKTADEANDATAGSVDTTVTDIGQRVRAYPPPHLNIFFESRYPSGSYGTA